MVGRWRQPVALAVEAIVVLTVLGLSAGNPAGGQTATGACAPGPLSQYEAMPMGCAVADLVFGRFSYSSSGAAPAASQIMVTPTVARTRAGLPLVEVTFSPRPDFSPGLHSALRVSFDASTRHDVKVTRAVLHVLGRDLVFAVFKGPGFNVGAFAGPPNFSGETTLDPPISLAEQPLTTSISMTAASARVVSWTIALATIGSASGWLADPMRPTRRWFEDAGSVGPLHRVAGVQ